MHTEKAVTAPPTAETAPPSSDAVLRRLLALHPKVIDLSLDRVLRLLAALGNPQDRLPPVVHVAGTNGKGSVIAILRACLEAAGYRVHVYTSPHLMRFNERVRLAGRLIAEDDLADVLLECESANGGAPITFFEITTAAAFLAFSRVPADITLIETGLGGRLDATNVVARPALTTITPVAVDHVQFLGDGLAAIAGEKAGILKPGTAAVIGPQPREAAPVLSRRAAALGAPVSRHGAEWSVEPSGTGLAYRGPGADLELPAPALAGAHQIDNAGMALACLDHLPGFRVDAAALRAGFGAVDWPARLQRLESGPLVALLPPDWEAWLDGGHNPGAGAALARWAAARPERPLHLVVGMLSSKDPEGFLRPLAPHAGALRGVAIPGEAASSEAEAIAAAARAAGIAAAPAAGVGEALADLARRAPGPARVLICGSLYLAGRVLAENG